jgi:hypothetical protein
MLRNGGAEGLLQEPPGAPLSQQHPKLGNSPSFEDFFEQD